MYYRTFFVSLHCYIEDILTKRTPPEFLQSALYLPELYDGKIIRKKIEKFAKCKLIVPTYLLFNIIGDT